MAADFNGDGKLDLVSADAQFTLLLGNGYGTFQPSIGYVFPYLATGTAVADFDDDGTGFGEGGAVDVYWGNPGQLLGTAFAKWQRKFHRKCRLEYHDSIQRAART